VGEWQATKVAIKVSNTAADAENFRREATLMVYENTFPNHFHSFEFDCWLNCIFFAHFMFNCL
jgi:hypothetical protein